MQLCNLRKKTGIKAGVFVEAQNSAEETRWMINQLKDRPSVAGEIEEASFVNLGFESIPLHFSKESWAMLTRATSKCWMLN